MNFGGKTDAAPHVWEALGDVPHYVEPFCGSCATLLLRPHPCNRTYYSETVNDADGILVNALRSLRLHPDATAEAASVQVSECDLTAIHLWLVAWKRAGNVERLLADVEWCDPVAGGRWLWGMSSWIGGGWCAGDGPWFVNADGRIEKRTGSGGVSKQLPHLTNGQGVNHAGTREPGVGEPTEEAGYIWQPDDFHPMTMPELRRWFAYLSARLRHVRIVNGDWRRVVTSGAAFTLPVRQGGGHCGVFLDPPYGAAAGRAMGLYAEESGTVAADVREWCLANGDNPKFRIVLAGFEGEGHESLEAAGWRVVEWFKAGWLKGGMAQIADCEDDDDEPKHQQKRERLWLSPHCLRAEDDDLPLFGRIG